jgi:hypothetical protein
VTRGSATGAAAPGPAAAAPAAEGLIVEPAPNEAVLTVQFGTAVLIAASLYDGRLLGRWDLSAGWPLATFESGIDRDGACACVCVCVCMCMCARRIERECVYVCV